MTHDEKVHTAAAMRTYGGGFVKALAMALLQADDNNAAIIVDGFPVYMAKYGPGSEFYAAAVKDSNDR
jgi:hypothetical protein